MSYGHWPASNILALYRLADVNDASGNSHTLTNNGTVTFGAGKIGNCALFGNANSGKYLSHNDGLGQNLATADGSISAWFLVQTLPESGEAQTIAAWCSTTSAQRYFYIQYINDSGTKKLRANCAGNNIDYSINLDTNKWYKVDLNIASMCEFFLNGISIGTASRGTTGNAYNAVSMGSLPWTSPATYLKGNVDEAVFFNAVRTAAAIRRRYAFERGVLM